MSFRVIGLSPEPFFHLSGLNADELTTFGAQRCIVDAKPGFPDRNEIRDLEIGETALPLNFIHQPADTPFGSSHAIFICEGSRTACEATDVVPKALSTRALSMRTFDAEHMMVDADLRTGPSSIGSSEIQRSQPFTHMRPNADVIWRGSSDAEISVIGPIADCPVLANEVGEVDGRQSDLS